MARHSDSTGGILSYLCVTEEILADFDSPTRVLLLESRESAWERIREIQLLTGATLFAKNLCRPILAPGMTDRQVGQLAKVMVLVLTIGALFLAIHSSATLVSLLLLGYAGVAQLFPGVVLGLFSKRVTTSGVLAGLATGITIVTFLMLTGRDPYRGLNAGFIALCFNFAVTGVVSLLMPGRVAGCIVAPWRRVISLWENQAGGCR